MARKDVLKGLLAATPPETVAPAAPRAQTGAIGAVSRSFADLKARAVIEIDPLLIDAGGMQDRLESDADEDSELLRSIREYGQQVPVLVRPHPEKDGRYQIVYGRRRVLALRDLGQPVKALVRDLDDRELVLAQGQENTARRDLSYIEKVNFARQMQEAGYERKIICDALSVDKTQISRMLSVVDRIPRAVIETIGAAASVGRDRWIALADQMQETRTNIDTLVSMINLEARNARSDDRFQAAWNYLNGITAKNKEIARAVGRGSKILIAPDGLYLGKAKFAPNTLSFRLQGDHALGFNEWLLGNLPLLFADWQDQQLGLKDKT